jgi:signal transduction histidine kinase/DNA-binding response OmpR family regulator
MMGHESSPAARQPLPAAASVPRLPGGPAGRVLGRLNIGGKLTLGFGVLVALTLFVAGLSYLASYAATTSINRTSVVRAPTTLASARAQANLLRMIGDVRAYLALEDQQYRDAYNQDRQAFEAELANLDALLRQSDVADPSGQDARRLDELKAAYAQWSVLPEPLFDLRDDQLRREPALRILIEQGNPLIASILVESNALILAQQQREPSADNRSLLGDMARFQSSFISVVSGLRGYVATRRENFKFEYSSNESVNAESFGQLLAGRGLLEPQQQVRLSKISQARDAFFELPPRMFAAVEGEHAREDLYLFRTQAVPVAETMLRLLDEITAEQQRLLQIDLAAGREQLAATQRQTLAVGVLALLCGLALAFVFRAHIAGPIRRLTGVAERIGAGDLEARAVVESGDEIGVLANTVNAMTAQLGRLYEAEHESRELAEAATASKSAFLATMSHEIRTPLNGVVGYSDLLLRTELSAEQREFAEIVRGSGEALLTIINDILDFSKIEAGKIELEAAPFDLRDCLEAVLDVLAFKASEKGLDLSYLMEDGVPAALVGDVARLRQVLLNLLNNALKFTEQGEVVLSVASRLLADARHELHFAVRDTGIGIPTDRLDRLFQSFSQVDASTSRKYGGTGLGLAISKRLSELMGGTMWVDSGGPGTGSTFHFTIVAQAAPALTVRGHLDAEQPSLLGKRLLVVDDNATHRHIVGQYARTWGMVVRDTASPAEALSWIHRGDPFDLAILDLLMPEMSGGTLAGEIRAHRDARVLPLVLCSAFGRELGPEHALFAAHLAKPLKPSQLFDALISIFARGEEATPVQKSAAPPPQINGEMASQLPLRILLAEDNAVNQKLALRILGQMGYRADVAANGLEAIAALERQPYDVVLMDVQMPELDGLDATRQICERWTRAERPRIIAMTANAMQGDRELCLAAGMDDYISKPIRPQELVDALSQSRPLAKMEG